MYKCIASNKVGRDERLIYFYVTSEYCGHPHQPSSLLERGRSLDLQILSLAVSALNSDWEASRRAGLPRSSAEWQSLEPWQQIAPAEFGRQTRG